MHFQIVSTGLKALSMMLQQSIKIQYIPGRIENSAYVFHYFLYLKSMGTVCVSNCFITLFRVIALEKVDLVMETVEPELCKLTTIPKL